jgi:hydrogenase nickel incorporation protein HypB
MSMHDVARINIGEDVIKKSEELGLENKRRLDEAGVKAFNIMGAIGSGKTSLIEIAIARLKDEYRIAVIAGDVIAKFDSDRFRKLGVPVVPTNTGKECHLDAHLVRHAIEQLRLDEVDILFVENVGNLICPSDFYLGEHKRVIVVSVTEGEEIVAKHPAIFKAGDCAIINKVDIAQFVDVDPDKMVSDAEENVPLVFKTSVRTGFGIEEWIDFIRKEVRCC